MHAALSYGGDTSPSSAPLPVWQTYYATQLRLTRIAFFLLSRMLLQLPRRITNFETLTIDQRRVLLERLAASRRNLDQGASGPGESLETMAAQPAIPSTRCGKGSIDLNHSTISHDCLAHPSAKQALSGTSGYLPGHVSGSSPLYRSQQHLSRAITVAQHLNTGFHAVSAAPEYRINVNVTGNNSNVSVDEVIQSMGRMHRAWRTREEKLQNEPQWIEKASAPFHGTITISGDHCTVGGSSVARRSPSKRLSKRKRDETTDEERSDGSRVKR